MTATEQVYKTMGRDEILALPSGRVLERVSKKIKVRIVQPAVLNKCEICFRGTDGEKMIKTEMGGNITILTECVDCYLRRT